MYLRECAQKSAKLTRWSLGLQDFDLIGSTDVAALIRPPIVYPGWGKIDR